jgi:hypothetical protein
VVVPGDEVGLSRKLPHLVVIPPNLPWKVMVMHGVPVRIATPLLRGLVSGSRLVSLVVSLQLRLGEELLLISWE